MSNIGNKETFSKNLSYYVKISGRDQKEIAEYVGVAPSTFNEWIKAKKYPRIDKIEKLATYFGILKSDLIEEKDWKNSPEEPKLTEGEKMWLELYHRVSDDTRDTLIKMMSSFDRLPEDRKEFALQVIRAALGGHK